MLPGCDRTPSMSLLRSSHSHATPPSGHGYIDIFNNRNTMHRQNYRFRFRFTYSAPWIITTHHSDLDAIARSSHTPGGNSAAISMQTANGARSCHADRMADSKISPLLQREDSLDSTPLTPHPMAHRCALFRPHFIHPLPFRRITGNHRRVSLLAGQTVCSLMSTLACWCESPVSKRMRNTKCQQLALMQSHDELQAVDNIEWSRFVFVSALVVTISMARFLSLPSARHSNMKYYSSCGGRLHYIHTTLNITFLKLLSSSSRIIGRSAIPTSDVFQTHRPSQNISISFPLNYPYDV